MENKVGGKLVLPEVFLKLEVWEDYWVSVIYLGICLLLEGFHWEQEPTRFVRDAGEDASSTKKRAVMKNYRGGIENLNCFKF